MEINNFYTATVYEKGAELIRMLKLLVGDAAYKKALDLYFARHDGQACTIEDWLAVFTDVTGQDLSQFKLWYSQAGTPIVTVRDHFADGTYELTLTQVTPPTPGQPNKQPLVIPLHWGFCIQTGRKRWTRSCWCSPKPSRASGSQACTPRRSHPYCADFPPL